MSLASVAAYLLAGSHPVAPSQNARLVQENLRIVNSRFSSKNAIVAFWKMGHKAVAVRLWSPVRAAYCGWGGL